MEKTVSLWVDFVEGSQLPRVDDFLVAIGKTKSNSVYHVADRDFKFPKNLKKGRVRVQMKCYKSDLITMLRREAHQYLFTFSWNPRKKSTASR